MNPETERAEGAQGGEGSDRREGIDPADLATALRVLEQLPALDADHPDIQTVKRATGRMYKQVRKARRREAKAPQVEHDEALLAQTATGSPMRIDDETKGILLTVPPVGATVGEYVSSGSTTFESRQ